MSLFSLNRLFSLLQKGLTADCEQEGESMIFSSQLGKLDGQTNEQATKTIANHLRKLQEELEYRLANLDSSNVTEINTDETTLSGGMVTMLSETEQNMAQMQVTAAQIKAQVTDEINRIESKVTQTAESFSSQIEDTNGNVTKLSQSLSSMKLSVENGDESSYIGLMVDGVVVSSQNIAMKGMVTFQGLEDGTTVVNGACIQTGKIKAKYLELSGAISFSDLSDYEDIQAEIDAAGGLSESQVSTLITDTLVSSPTIVGGKLYAAEEDSYMEFESYGFYLYDADNSRPRVSLTYFPGYAVQFVLGAGTSSASSMRGRMLLNKGTGDAGIYYYSETTGETVGFTFNNDGTITVHGTLSE